MTTKDCFAAQTRGGWIPDQVRYDGVGEHYEAAPGNRRGFFFAPLTAGFQHSRNFHGFFILDRL
ncbi:hypothetical protein JZX86_22355 [Agrobacterium rosae]|uniref:hypothetical protein n=1 Tax=Agrobacterium rosae TaxID=1972867 RepID=UPI0019D34970|nr:hypothetical protein [Agrobacterium rosae]MBN7808093.1 hypothetical protein [Agrobacterium rosae]